MAVGEKQRPDLTPLSTPQHSVTPLSTQRPDPTHGERLSRSEQGDIPSATFLSRHTQASPFVILNPARKPATAFRWRRGSSQV